MKIESLVFDVVLFAAIILAMGVGRKSTVVESAEDKERRKREKAKKDD